MGLSKDILLTIKDYEVKLDKDIKFYEYDTINLCFSIMEYGIVVKNGVSVNKLMPIQALKAYMLIETPDKKDYAEATKIEDNKVVFNLGNKYSRFIGVGRMQIVIKDADGCRITLPEFPFEIKESINTGWDDAIDFLETEHDVIIADELGRPIETTKISEFDETDEITPQTYTMVINEDGNKKIKLDTIMESVSEMIEFDVEEIDRRIDEMIEVYDDEEVEVEFPSLYNDIERIKGEINEISESLEHMENTKNDYPILECENDDVKDITKPYGNILRYGATNNKDSTKAIHKAFEVCKLTGHSVKLPNEGQYRLLEPIILHSGVKYKMVQDNNIGFVSQPKADYRIMCKCDMFKTTDENKEVSMDIDGVTVVFNEDGLDNGYINNLSVFHKVRVIQSVINNFTVECAGYFFKEAGCNVNTIIQNSYIHSLSIAFSGDVNVNYLMSDSIIKNCRISGRANQNPVFLDGQVDTDMKFEGNFIDYFAYFMGGTSTTTAYHCGVSIGNTFNRMFRMFKNSGKGTFINNTFEYFNKDSAFTNKTSLMENGKWGAFVFDKENEYRGYQDLTLIDNIVHDCDYFLYYVPNNTSNNAYGTNIIERGTIGLATYETFIFNPRTSSSKVGYLSSKILSLDYEDRSTESVPTSLTKQETYNGTNYNIYDTWCGCHRFYNDGLYIACPDLTWKKIT